MGVLILLVCMRLSGLSFADRQAAALRHGTDLLAIERDFRFDVESRLNRWLAAHHGITAVTNYTYATDYIVTSLALLVFLYLRRPAMYRWARNSCIVLNLAAAACFALFPVAPPRLTPGLGVVDTVLHQHMWGSWGSPVGNATDQMSAMPSLHFGLAAWVVVMLFLAGAPVIIRLLAILNMFVTVFVIIATGNHYLLDVLAAAVLVAASVLVTAPRRRGSTPDTRVNRLIRQSGPNVAGVVFMEADATSAALSVRWELMRADRRWRQRLDRTTGPYVRWTGAEALDWSWHINRLDPVAGGSSRQRLDAVRPVADRVAGGPFPADRPRWRAWVVPVDDGPEVAVIVVVCRALHWRSWLDRILRSTGIIGDAHGRLDTLLSRLRLRQPLTVVPAGQQPQEPQAR